MCGMNVPCAASNSDHAHEHTVNMSRHKTNEYNAFLAPLSWWNLKQTNRIPIKILTVRYAVPFVPICCVRPQIVAAATNEDTYCHLQIFCGSDDSGSRRGQRRQKMPMQETRRKNNMRTFRQISSQINLIKFIFLFARTRARERGVVMRRTWNIWKSLFSLRLSRSLSFSTLFEHKISIHCFLKSNATECLQRLARPQSRRMSVRVIVCLLCTVLCKRCSLTCFFFLPLLHCECVVRRRSQFCHRFAALLCIRRLSCEMFSCYRASTRHNSHRVDSRRLSCRHT